MSTERIKLLCNIIPSRTHKTATRSLTFPRETENATKRPRQSVTDNPGDDPRNRGAPRILCSVYKRQKNNHGIIICIIINVAGAPSTGTPVQGARRRHSPAAAVCKKFPLLFPTRSECNGVYHGTSLGPLLFNVFSNDLSLNVENVRICKCSICIANALSIV